MTKLKSMLVTLAMLLCCVPVSAHSFEVDGIYYNIIDSEKLTVAVTYGGRDYNFYVNEYKGSVVIPETVTYESKTYSVTSIGWDAFYECISLTSVTIPDGVTSIGDNAFYGCRSLTSVTIPNSVTYINKWAFCYCSSLTSVTIPDGVTSIGDNTFYGCTSLTSVTIPNSVTSIGDAAFYGCNLKTMIIGLGVTSIGSRQSTPVKTIWLTNTPPEGYSRLAGTINYVATENYSSLSNKTIYPYLKSMFVVDGVTYVPVDMTKKTCDVIDCSYEESEKNINIGKSVTYKNISMAVEKVKPYAFYGYDYIKTAILDYVGEIGTYSFSGCTNLNTVTLGNDINSIGDYVFSDCTNLNTVTLGDSINSIGDYAFSGCTNLNELTIGSGLQTIGASAFKGCTAITEIDTKATTPPTCGSMALDDINKWECTLNIPKGCSAAYQAAEQWKEFFFITEGEGGEPVEPETPEEKVCATPTISYENGKLIFNCETEGAVCKSTITDDDIASFEANEVQLNVTYNISVYATKEGYKDSEVAKATLCWIDVEPKSEGLTDTDIANVKALPVVVQASNGTITVSGANDGTMVEVYGISGTKLGEAKTTLNKATIHTDAQAGSVVIVKVGNKAIKIKI